MFRKLWPVFIVIPALVAGWLTFSAPAASALNPDQVIAADGGPLDDDSDDDDDEDDDLDPLAARDLIP